MFLGAAIKPLLKFIPFSKIEEDKDGTLLVHGIATAELPDLENEICDYLKTKPYYQAMAQDRSAMTMAVEGMEASVFPLREMHQMKSAGAGRAIEFDDDAKTIRVTAHVIDPVSAEKVRKGSLVGFSQAGRVVGAMTPDPIFKGCMRYVADPSEISLVDAPCLPAALIDRISEKALSVTFAKANGSIETRLLIQKTDKKETEEVVIPMKTRKINSQDLTADCFAYAPGDDPSKWRLVMKVGDGISTRGAILGALALIKSKMPLAGIPDSERSVVKSRLILAAKDQGIDLPKEIARCQKAIQSAQDGKIEKGMGTVQEMADMLQQLTWIQYSVTWEREMEGDASVIPDDLGKILEELARCFLAMAAEETAELIATIPGSEDKAAKADATAEVEKSKGKMKALMSHIEKALGQNEKMMAHHADMQKTSEKLSEMHKEMADNMDAARKSTAGKDGYSDVAKAQAHHEIMHKAHKGLAGMHKAMAAQLETHSACLAKAMEACEASMSGKEPEKAMEKDELMKLPEVVYLSTKVETLEAELAKMKAAETKKQEDAAVVKAKEDEDLAKAAKEKETGDIAKALTDLNARVEKAEKELEDFKKAADPENPVNKVKGTLVARPGEQLNVAKASQPVGHDLKFVGV